MYVIVNKLAKFDPNLATKLKEASEKTAIPYDNLAYQFSRKKEEVFENELFWIRKVEDAEDALKKYASYMNESKAEGQYVGSFDAPGGHTVKVYAEAIEDESDQ